MSTTKNQYNPYNLEAKFKSYLSSNNFSRISRNNYLNDIRSFLTWFSHTLRSQHLSFDLQHFSPSMVHRYIDHLKESGVPAGSINRSLSSLRTFGRYLVHDEYIQSNPLKDIKNIKQSQIDTIRIFLKKHTKPAIAFIIGFLIVSFVFITPSIFSSAYRSMDQKRDTLLNDTQQIQANFSDTPAASTSAGLNTIPIVDENGTLNLTAPYPKIRGHEGTLSIEAPQLSLGAQDDGNLTLRADQGSIHFSFEGEKPKLPFDAAFYFTGENLNSGTLIYGQGGLDSSSVSLLELSSGTPAETKFRVDGEGNVHIKGNIILEGNLIVNPDSTIFGTFSSQTATTSASF